MIHVNEEYIDQFSEAIFTILKGEVPKAVILPSDFPDNEIKQFSGYLNEFIAEYESFSKFMYSMARGELSYHPPKGKLKVIQSFKALQSNLRHITWKTQQIAAGDFDQKIDFMGDFSKAFNHMTNQLKHAFAEIEKKNKELEHFNKQLQKQKEELRKKAISLNKAKEKIELQRNKIEKQKEMVIEQHKQIVIKNQQLAISNSSKDKLFSIISHDLRGPFGNIYTATNILRDVLKTSNYDKVDDLASLILESSKQSMGLLDNLLIWSRAQTGRLFFYPQKFNLSTVINDIINMYISTANLKNINLVSDYRSGLYVFADIDMVKTIVRNLLSNALKFTPSNGTIMVSVYKNILPKKQKDKYYEINISDTGIGIHPDNLKKIFNQNISFSSEGTMNEKGSGLGLVLCKDFVDKNGGTIQVKSVDGEGTNFMFTLPKA